MPLLIGIITGFFLCIPIGPVNLMVITTDLKEGFTRGLAIGLGDATMCFIYFASITTGLTLIEFNPQIVSYMKIVGILLIAGLGIKEVLARPITLERNNDEDRSRKRNYFFLGVLVYVTNPTMLVTLTGISAYIKSLQLFTENFSNNIIFSLATSIGTILWFLFLLYMLRNLKNRINGKLLNIINKTSGTILILLAIYLAYKFFF